MVNKKYPQGVREHYGKLQINFKPREFKTRVYETVSDNISANQITAAGKLRQEIIDKIKHDIFVYADYFPDSKHARADLSSHNTFSYYAQLWADNPGNDWKQATKYKFLGILNRVWMPEFHNKIINKIEYSDITRVLKMIISGFKEKNNREPSVSIYNDWLTVVRAVFNEAAKDKNSDISRHDNPTTHLINKKRVKPLINPFELHEMDAIISDIYKHDGVMFGAWFEFGFFTGMRHPSEPSALLWQKVDLNRGEFHIDEIRTKAGIQKATKTSVNRTVLLNDRSLSALQTLREITGFTNEFVFLQDDKSPVITASPHIKVWKASLRRLGFSYRDPYTMRHSYATFCLMQGLNPAFVCKQLGHSLEEFFKTYATWINSDNNANEMEKLKEILTPSVKNGAKTGRFIEGKNKSNINQLVIGAKGETRNKN